ncbi:MAG: hypothetical protein ACPG61_08405 [Paracoccaceae bacterium]
MVDGNLLICRNTADEESWRMDLTRVDATAFVVHKVKHDLFWRFDLIEDATRHSVSLTIFGGHTQSDPAAPVLINLTRAICNRIAETRPDMPLTIGEYGKYSVAWLTVGVLSTLASIGLLIGALSENLSSDRWVTVGISVLVLFLIGIGICIGYNPWRDLPVVRVGDIDIFLDNAARALMGQTSEEA